jgi:Flp pilus assembly pilin Flp
MVDNALLWTAAWAATLGSSLRSRMSSERGQGIMEYGVLLGAIALIAATALYVTGGTLSFSSFKSKIQACINLASSGCT